MIPIAKPDPCLREALLYERVAGERVRCLTCERVCQIAPGERGFCRTRQNIGGRLYTLVYGDINALSANPIEKKPFFHFWPGSTALTFSTWSCNLTCPWCQNWHLSKYPPEPGKANYIEPARVVDLAVSEACQGLSVSFTEPLMLFEYSLDTFPLARKRGLYNNYVSNGYMTLQALARLAEAGMDAIKLDVKGCGQAVQRYCGADVKVVWRNAAAAKRLGLHLEVVNLVIPGVNDDESCLVEVVEEHLKAAGPDTPLHFTGYYPAYQFTRPPTPVQTLEKAYELAKQMGVSYPYIGNIPGHRYENTHCPECHEPLIKRYGFTVVKVNLEEGRRCPKCRLEIPIVGRCLKG